MKIATLVCGLVLALSAVAGATSTPRIQVCFVPDYEGNQSCAREIVAAINLAKHRILV